MILRCLLLPLCCCLLIVNSLCAAEKIAPLDELVRSDVLSLKPTVQMDLTKKGEPLSELIYGQFIEHLGRCIYGGIWAEMLEDRKFFFPVGSPESAWYPIYQCPINMNSDQPFVGEHTPESIAGNEPRWLGVAQKGLAVKKGMKYPGYAWIKATEGIEQVEIHLHWSPVHEEFSRFTFPVQTGDYYKIEYEFESPVDYDDVEIEIAAYGKNGSFFVGTASLMPGDHVQGMRADTLALLKELNAPIYRWPGGNFVSGYDWKDGTGERDRRPPRKNPAWLGVEHNDFGINEFMLFCKILGTEPYIAVNTGDGDVANALAELEYVNGSADSNWGKKRAEEGQVEPYKVKWWGLGNEMYGDWQIGHIPVSEYVKRHNLFADAFRKADSSIRLIGVGAVGKWDETFIPGCAHNMDDISEHFYVQDKRNVGAHVQLVPNEIRRIANAHREYRKTMPELKGKDIKIALDEWNYWYGPYLFGELGTRYFQKDGLGIAAGLHEFARQSDLFIMANYAQTVNVIGCIKTDKKNAQFETTGLVLKLYRKEFGSIPVATEIIGDKTSSIDVQGMLSEDGKWLSVAIVNPFAFPIELTLEGVFEQFDPEKAEKFVIADPENNPKSYNDPGQPQRIEIVHSTASLKNGVVGVQPYSVTLLKFPNKK